MDVARLHYMRWSVVCSQPLDILSAAVSFQTVGYRRTKIAKAVRCLPDGLLFIALDRRADPQADYPVVRSDGVGLPDYSVLGCDSSVSSVRC